MPQSTLGSKFCLEGPFTELPISKTYSMLLPEPNAADVHSFTQISPCVSFPEDSGSGPGSRPAVLWPQHSRHNGHEQRRLSGPGRGFSRRCRSAVVGIWRSLSVRVKTPVAPVIRDTVSPSQVTQRRADLRQRPVRAQQDQHLRQGLSARRQRRDLHVGYRVF